MVTSFNPRAPYGARLPGRGKGESRTNSFNPRAPYGARLDLDNSSGTSSGVSIHAPRTGRDVERRQIAEKLEFQSTRPVRGATNTHSTINQVETFQSTRPVRGATIAFEFPERRQHRFNPRAPYGARQERGNELVSSTGVSIHAPRTGRDHRLAGVEHRKLQVSIHAPRTGRDGMRGPGCKVTKGFNPRAPYGARRLQGGGSGERDAVSIHAPRTGRDMTGFAFYAWNEVSIHAPRTGRDKPVCWIATSCRKFQSTRPVRGATAPRLEANPKPSSFNPRAPYGARP